MCRLLLSITAIAITMASCGNKNAQNTSGNDVAFADSLQLALESVSDKNSMYLIVGTYTSGESEGMYVYQLDTVSGYSKLVSQVAIDNPSYLTLSPNEKYVYAVTENTDSTASASAFAFDKQSGKLSLIGTQPTRGGAPCYIATDADGKHVITANYTGANISIFGTSDNGGLKPLPQLIAFEGKGLDANRQKQPHIHCVRFSPDQNHLFVSDLGTDRIHKLDVNENVLGDFLKVGVPASFATAPGSGPRHIDFHPNGKYAYLVTEISGDVVAFDYANGNLTQIQTIKADTLDARGSGDIHVSPDGRFVYASNRLKGDGIAIFAIDQATGRLTKEGYQETGIHPRNFVITPNSKYLLVASRDSNVIQIFAINPVTGLLCNANKDIKLSMPVCLKLASFE